MPAKKLKLELLDASGQPAANVAVKASGCDELTSSPIGTALFLVEEPQVTVTVGGQAVFNGPLESLPEKMTVRNEGGSWKA